MPRAASGLDAGGTTEYERERIRARRIGAATPSAVRTFAVPTTALLRAGYLLEARKKIQLPVEIPELPNTRLTEKPGYGPMKSAVIAAYAAQFAAIVRPVAPAPSAAIPPSAPVSAPGLAGVAPGGPPAGFGAAGALAQAQAHAQAIAGMSRYGYTGFGMAAGSSAGGGYAPGGAAVGMGGGGWAPGGGR